MTKTPDLVDGIAVRAADLSLAYRDGVAAGSGVTFEIPVGGILGVEMAAHAKRLDGQRGGSATTLSPRVTAAAASAARSAR